MLEEQGISAAVVHGDMPDDERQETLRRFREGSYTRVL
jgi:superfamily II DNA/RNA helicase